MMSNDKDTTFLHIPVYSCTDTLKTNYLDLEFKILPPVVSSLLNLYQEPW